MYNAHMLLCFNKKELFCIINRCLLLLHCKELKLYTLILVVMKILLYVTFILEDKLVIWVSDDFDLNNGNNPIL